MAAKIKTAGPKKSVRPHHKPKRVSRLEFEKVYWPYLPVLLILVFLLSISVQSGALSASFKNPIGGVLNYATSMSINELLASTNTERLSDGSVKLNINSSLNASAQAKANDMAERNYWSHETPEGDAPWVFVIAQGYKYQKLGENLAAGFSDAESAVKGWMGSPGHRANLLDPSFSEVGFGFANNPDYTSAGGGPMTIIVAHYGKPAVLTASTTQNPPVAQTKSPAASTSSRPTSQIKTPKIENKPEPARPSQPSTAINTEAGDSEIVAASTIKASRAQLALGSIVNFSVINSLTALILLSIAGLWATRHLLAIRRVLTRGETLAIKHPLTDIGLLVIVALCFLLSRTAGLLQ